MKWSIFLIVIGKAVQTAASLQSVGNSSFSNVSCTMVSSASVCFNVSNATTTSSSSISSSSRSPVSLTKEVNGISKISSSSSSSAFARLSTTAFENLVNSTIYAATTQLKSSANSDKASTTSRTTSNISNNLTNSTIGDPTLYLTTATGSSASHIDASSTEVEPSPARSHNGSSMTVASSSLNSNLLISLSTQPRPHSLSAGLKNATFSRNISSSSTMPTAGSQMGNITSAPGLSPPHPTFGSTTVPDPRNTTEEAGFANVTFASPAVNSTRPSHLQFGAQAQATNTPKPKAVFAHYLVGTVTAAHANQDIDEAMAMGLDGFALNIGDPSADFLPVSLDNIFGYAEYRNFKLFISMDVYASGNACHGGSPGACGGPIAYETILKSRLISPSWYLGPNGLPLISTYSSGGGHNDTWSQWKTDFASRMFFIPDFDETRGYYSADAGWYAYWGDLVNGVFSWESAWPYRSGYGGKYPGDISPDLVVQSEMTEKNKSYMMPLSSLQYKNSYGANVYRAGDLNLPVRMEDILAMEDSPDFVQIITWNDGPEGHYIGNLWLEQNNDTAPMRYANQLQFPHHPWQTLITPFIVTYKNGGKAIDMAPVDNSPAVGAIWYKTIMKSSVCPNAPNSNLYNATPPDGFDTATDTMSYAIVIPPGAPSYSLRAISNGTVTVINNLRQGLNYGSVNIQPGYQRMELVNGNQIVLAATGGRCISAGCPDCIYNMNPQVIAFLPDTGDLGTCPYQACEKKVFAHYMIGNVYPEHAHQDIDDAVALGLDGFALNVGDPTQPFVRQSFNNMFDYARDNHRDFKLFISLDLWAEGNAFQGIHIDYYYDLLRDFLGHPAWLIGPNGYPFISTYSSGGMTDAEWISWKETLGNKMYFVPDFDDTRGYNTSDPGWWGYWGDIIDGAMSWESTWAKPGIGQAGNISMDEVVVTGTFQHRKSYMMPLSALQYKDSYDTNYYRQGDLNLPLRMEKILSMEITPDFVEYLTWNDGPESHYMGTLWEEQNNDTQPGLYANQRDWSHTGWQSLLASFITAFKAGLPASQMTPPNGQSAIGALWYKSILQSTQCPAVDPSAIEYQYSVKPNGFDSGTDQLNWAVVLPPSASGMSIRAISGGEVISTVNLHGGLNYGAANGVQKGPQRLELVDSSGNIILAASGGRCISDNCPDCIYNMNPQVVALAADTGATGPCPDQWCLSPDGSVVPPTIYYPPDLWNSLHPVVSCEPPCTIVLPPYPIGSTTTMTWPPFGTTLLSFSDGTTYTKTTIITVAAITTTEIQLWSISIRETDTTEASFFPEQSVMPESFTITLPGTEATFPPTHYSGNTLTSPSTSSASTSGIILPGTDYVVTIQPQPTVSMTQPPPTLPAVTYTPGPDPSPSTYLITTTSGGSTRTESRTAGLDSGHSSKDCSKLFGCGCECGPFACDGGAGIFGLHGGGCLLGGCGGGCGGSTVPYATLSLGGAPTGPAVAPPPTPPPPPPDSPPPSPSASLTSTCATSTIASMCIVSCDLLNFGSRTQSKCGSTTCTQTITACEATGTISTTFVSSISCPSSYEYTPWWTDTNQIVPSVGDIVATGTYTTPRPWTVPNPYPFTQTDIWGDLIECQGSTTLNIGYGIEPVFCTGSSSMVYTAPGAFPFTTTDASGDIVACQTSYVALTSTECGGFSRTVYTAPPPPTTSTTSTTSTASTTSTTSSAPPAATNLWGWWKQDDHEEDCVDSHCTHSSDIWLGYAMRINDPCHAKQGFEAQGTNGRYITYNDYEDVMIFNDGVCGSPKPYTCTRTGSDSDTWNCLDDNQSTLSTCTLTGQSIESWPEEVCIPNPMYYLVMNCTTTFDSISCQ